MKTSTFSRRVLGWMVAAAATVLVALPTHAGDTNSTLPTVGAVSSTNRAWAAAIQTKGLPNLHKVTDGLYRGAQPTAEGIKTLKEMGIKTIVCLRAFHTDKDELGTTKIDCVYIPIKTWDPEPRQVMEFLRIATDKARQPVFVHCQHGADRTGTMCALYRVVVQGWTKDQAIAEMTQGGFGFHEMWKNLIKFIREFDTDSIRTDLEKERKKAPAPAQPPLPPMGACCDLSGWGQPALLFVALLVLGFFFAKVEIQIEGPHGWAGALPTWRIEKHPMLNVFMGGRAMTGYHAWIFPFMALLFHFPLVACGTFSWPLEARIVGSLMLFWIIEDFLWFVLNPAFGIRKFRPDQVPWHKHWLAGVPVDYLIFSAIGMALIGFSYRHILGGAA